MNVLIIDNYDSFTYNLSHLVARVTGKQPSVRRNDEVTLETIRQLAPDAILLSPGPGHPSQPRDFGICAEILASGEFPVLGVCLGHQGIAVAFGGQVALAKAPMHGIASHIRHCASGLFAGIPQGFAAVRYHSLAACEPLPLELEALAWSDDGEIMALRHKNKPLFGIQFHPESIATEYGSQLLANFFEQISPAPLPLPTDCDAERAYIHLFAADEHSFWLDSSQGGRYSFIGGSSVPGSFLTHYEDLPRNARTPRFGEGFHGGYVGYLGFEQKGVFGYSNRHKSRLPDSMFLFAPAVLRFDHIAQTVELATTQRSRDLDVWAASIPARMEQLPKLEPPAATTPASAWVPRLKESEYRDRIAAAKHKILSGESYEICLTDMLTGAPLENPLSYYRALRKRNPAPYSAFIKFGKLAIACTSPERFLRVQRDRTVTSKPIKGTAPLSATPEKLLASEKDCAEHLMIVDLVRNDLGKVCQPNSVHVPVFRDVETYANVHQMVSTVQGTLREDCGVLDAIEAAFPPGSMTGAPKARTLEILDQLEAGPRGIYSGTIGWIGLDGACDLNVVIRTAVITETSTEIGSGGAITALSDADRELEELQLKIKLLTEAS